MERLQSSGVLGWGGLIVVVLTVYLLYRRSRKVSASSGVDDNQAE